MDFKVLLETIDNLDEKITKDTPMGDVIKDFQQSDAPQFKGKSKEKRKQMALAAKLSKESIEDLNSIRKLSGLREADEQDIMDKLQAMADGPDGEDELLMKMEMGIGEEGMFLRKLYDKVSNKMFSQDSGDLEDPEDFDKVHAEVMQMFGIKAVPIKDLQKQATDRMTRSALDDPELTGEDLEEGQSPEVVDFMEKIANSNDGADLMDQGLRGKHGPEIQKALMDMYDSISSDHRYHPDDDFENIEAQMLSNIEDDYATNEGLAEDMDLSDKTEELTQWFIKYDGYRGDNGDQLPMGWIKSMTATGVGPDGWEVKEWSRYQDKLGKDITDMDDEEIDAFIDDPKNSPITSAMIDDLLKITGASTADEDLARAVSSAIGIGESLEEGQYDGKSREELLKMKKAAEEEMKNYKGRGMSGGASGKFLDDTDMMMMKQRLDAINDALAKMGESVEEGAVEKLKLSPEMQEKVKNATEAELERMAFAFGGDSLRAGDELDMLRKAKAELQGKKDEGFDRDSFRKAFEAMVEAKSKPDFLDLDGDGNKKEPMKKAAKEAGKSKGGKKGMSDKQKKYFGKKKTDESINEDPYSQMPADMKEKIIAMYAKMLGGDKKKADQLLQRALSPKGQAAIKQKFGVGEDLEEGKSKHPKGSKKYKDQMAAKHAAMNEAFDEDDMDMEIDANMDMPMDPDQEMDMSPEQVIDQADEIDMAMGQLEFIKYAAEEIKGHFKMGFEMEEWFQNKLARVHGTMMTLHAYIEGEEGKAGMNESINESIERLFQEEKLGFEDAVRVVRESGGQQTINFVDTALYKWASRVANQKFEGRKAELYAGLLYERNGGDFEITDVLQEGVFDKDGMLGKFVSRDNGTDITTGKPNAPTFMGVNVKTRDDKIKALKTQIQMAKRSAPKSGLTPKDVPDLEKKLAKLEKEAK